MYWSPAVAPQDGAGFFDFHVAVEASRPWFRPLCVFALDGRQPFTPLAQGEAVQDTDTGCAFYTAANIGSDEIAPNLYD